ncbi:MULTISPECIES: class I adenylate-forming enzyme family protein [Actinomycetes]|uniref:class I adenylate-forming enzyme family protein n=1 Tax=Actinomycetes TaxID=1760 RepID=UPI0004C07608|nr:MULTISPECIES: class I adenylate-forming enzyme family protein [Actinomycetes]
MTTSWPTYAELPTRAAQRWPDRTALTFEHRSWTYRQFDAAVTRVAHHLSQAGVSAGTRALLLMENRPEYLICQFALARLGAAFSTPNPYWTVHEIRSAVESLQATTAIHSARHRDLAAEYPISVEADDLDIAPGGDITSHAPTNPISVDPDRALCIPFSSGTTGLPKGVVHTHMSLSGGIGQLVTHLDLSETDRLQVSLPLCHIFGTSMVGAALSAGASVTLFGRFDYDRCLAQIKADGVTVWPLAGTVAHRLAQDPGIDHGCFPALRCFMWGGSAVPPKLARAVTAKTGVGFLCSYGMTEAFAVAFNPVRDPTQWLLDSPGFSTVGTHIRLAEDGEIEVKGPCVAASYTVETARAVDDPFLEGGWFRTGDIGRVDEDGRLWIIDRRKDMIKVSGFQVAPAEVESELLAHPAIADAAVIGIPDEEHGERVVAFVVAAGPFSVDDLLAEVSLRLATYKMPSEVVTVENLPRTEAGKLQRARLRSQYSDQAR